jgi:DNA-binding transcriptional LysR family regulator
MSLDLKNLALFLRVATLGAIGRAGEEFDLSATNASQRIQTLEAELGVKLFHRTTRAVTLTPDGQVFIEHARRILDDVEEAHNVFSGNASVIKGTLRVTMSASFGRSHILPFVPELLHLYPNLKLELDFSDTTIDIIEQGYDIAFRMGELESSSLLARKVDDNPMLLVASPDYLERSGEPKTPEDLMNHSCLPFGRMNVWQLKGEDGKRHDVTVSGPVMVNLGDAIGDLVLAGMGIGLASMWYVGPDLLSGKIVPVLPDYKVWPETKIWAVRPPGRLTPARVKAFLDFMQERIRETNQARYGEYLK